MSAGADYIKDYEEHWKGIVESPDGTLDKDKVMRELADYGFLMTQASKVYMHVTDGMLSKTNYFAETIKEVADEKFQEHFDLEEFICDECEEVLQRESCNRVRPCPCTKVQSKG